MLNELYTFAEPVQVVPFSSLKWGKFTLLHTHDNLIGDMLASMGQKSSKSKEKDAKRKKKKGKRI